MTQPQPPYGGAAPTTQIPSQPTSAWGAPAPVGTPSGSSGNEWYRKRSVQLVAVGVLGLGLGGAAGGSGASDAEARAAAAEGRAEVAEASTDDVAERLTAAVQDRDEARAAAAAAESAAEEKFKAERQAVAAKDRERAAELTAKDAALQARERKVGVAEAAAAANTVEGDGVYLVGSDIRPGTYKSAGGESCYWSRNDKANEILDNHLGAGPTVIVIRASDFSVSFTRCAEFVRVSG